VPGADGEAGEGAGPGLRGLLRPRRSAARWVPVAAWAALLRWLSSRPPDELPAGDLLNLFPDADKVVHFGFYGVLGLLVVWATAPRRERGALALGALAGLLWGCLDEWLQAYAPGRSPDFLDILADTLGAGLGGWALFRLTGRLRGAPGSRPPSVDPPRPRALD